MARSIVTSQEALLSLLSQPWQTSLPWLGRGFRQTHRSQDSSATTTNLGDIYASLMDRAGNFTGIFLVVRPHFHARWCSPTAAKREHSMTRLAILAVALAAFATPVHAQAVKSVTFNGNVFDAPGQPTLQSPAATGPKAVHHVKKKKSSAS
jgi:hypothetical protein